MKISRVGLTLLGTACLLAACSSNSGSGSNPVACVPPAGDTPFLAFPASGSTGNSPNIGQVIVADQTALGSGWDAVVTVSGIGSQLGGTFQPAALPLPSPNATPPFANPVYESSAFNVAVPAGSTVQVSVNNLNSTCTPVVIGSFGT